MCVFNMCVSKLCVFKKFVSEKLGSFQDLLVKMLAFMGVITGMFFMGNTVSDPSSVIDALKAFNTTSTPLTCNANQLAHHYKNLAFDVTFLSITIALAACVVCCVKFIVDAGAQEEERKQCEANPSTAAQAADDCDHAENALKAASDAKAAAVQAEADAKRAVKEKQADSDRAREVATDARSKADLAIDAARVADAEAKTNPADNVLAAAQEKLQDAQLAAGQTDKAEDKAEKADQALKEAQDDAIQKGTSTREAKKSAKDAKKTADAAKPKTGMARFPHWLRWVLRVLVLFATVVSCYSCIVATDSFMELLKYKTSCVRFDGDSQSRHAARIALSISRGMLYAAFGLLHLMFVIGACCTD